jgi:deoxyribonuclease V
MKVTPLHSWDLDYKQAVELQKILASKLQFSKLDHPVQYVAGADISYSKADPRIFGAVVILKLPEFTIIESSYAYKEIPFPYIPGLLAFRELPILWEIFKKIKKVPDVVICDGQGIAHPRKLGLASHLGLLLKIPTIGCAKKRLVGEYAEPGKDRWSESPMIYKGDVVGAALRSREKVKPIFISPGHMIDLNGAIAVVKSCITKYRLPESTRLAHQLVNKLRLEHSGKK